MKYGGLTAIFHHFMTLDANGLLKNCQRPEDAKYLSHVKKNVTRI